MSDTNPRECFICSRGNAQTVEEHHTVPQRLNGSDEPENLYWLCGNCHNAVEDMYDDDFYRRLGIAVDQVENDAFVEHERGTKVAQHESIDREIPPRSDHVHGEWWGAQVCVTALENDDYHSTTFPRRVEQRLHTHLEAHSDEILTEYQERVRDHTSIREFYNEIGKDIPEYVDPEKPPEVSFVHIPENDCKIPRIQVTNHHKNGFAYSHDDCKDAPGINREFGTELGVIKSEYPQPFYRLHCSYCHTVFSQDEHSDMARHLRMYHGIENPYELRDKTFNSAKKPSMSDHNE
jgi:hypothetical protein